MIDIKTVTALISALRVESVKDAITPEVVGSLLQRLADLIGTGYSSTKTSYTNNKQKQNSWTAYENEDENCHADELAYKNKRLNKIAELRNEDEDERDEAKHKGV